ncbi:hypothetical protein FACS1894170_11160 [Planctomycetales bacterium]|nr:hypothetical protein FACS1894170_11160 [Planctomycetales bacterium]
MSIRTFLHKLFLWRTAASTALFAAIFTAGNGEALAADFAAANIYQHRWNSINQSVNSRFDTYFTFNPMEGFEEFFGQAPPPPLQFDDESPAAPQPVVQSMPVKFLANLGNTSLWGNYIGRSGNLIVADDSDLSGTVKSYSNGVQCGFDFATFRGFVVGAMFGYENHRSKFEDEKTHTDDYYFGVYTGKQFVNGFDIRGAVGYGSQKYRFDGDTPSGRTLEANLEIGRRFYKGPNCSLRPFVAFDYLNNKMDSAGDDQLKLSQGLLRFGTDAKYVRDRLGLTGLFSFSQGVIGNQMADWYGESIFTVGCGGSYTLNTRHNWTLFANYNADIFANGNGDVMHSFALGTQLRF